MTRGLASARESNALSVRLELQGHFFFFAGAALAGAVFVVPNN